MSFWTLGQCLFGHDRLRERGADGVYRLVCQDCRDAQPVLADQPVAKRIPPLKAKKVKRVKFRMVKRA